MVEKKYDKISKITLSGQTYFQDDKNDIYVVNYKPNNYSFEINKLIYNDSKDIIIENVKNPTQNQLEYALANYILMDNQTNIHKAGCYRIDENILFKSYAMYLDEIKNNNLQPSDLFEKFALAPKGEYWQGALNQLIKKIFAEIQGKDENTYEYVFRNTNSTSNLNLHREADGSLIVAKPDLANYGYQIYIIKNNVEIKVQEPTFEMKKSALLNIVLTDNCENPNKTGIYNIKKTIVEDTLENIIKLYPNKNNTWLKILGIAFESELKQGMAEELANDIYKNVIANMKTGNSVKVESDDEKIM